MNVRNPQESTLGILNPHEGFKRFSLARYEPAPDLARFVDGYWIVRWDLTDEPPFVQEILPFPCAHLTFERGVSAVRGAGTRRFVRKLEGRGRVVGTKFTPSGFCPFARTALAALVDRAVPVVEAFGAEVATLESRVLAPDDDARSIAVVESFLRSRRPRATSTLDRVAALVRLVQSDRSIARVEDLAREASMSIRTLQRHFERYVGVGPKWVIRRSRVQDAAERVATGAKVDWAALAQELGYNDQSHLIHDFRDQVGFTPAAYAARCAGARRAKGGHRLGKPAETRLGTAR
jgi:AraC-like DNA-binding protein